MSKKLARNQATAAGERKRGDLRLVPSPQSESCPSECQVLRYPCNGEFCWRTAAAKPNQLLTTLSWDSIALLVLRKPRKDLTFLPSPPHNTWLPGTINPYSTSAISLQFPPTLPYIGVWVAQVTKILTDHGISHSKNEFKEGVKESYSKSSVPPQLHWTSFCSSSPL